MSSIYRSLAECVDRNEAVALCTVVRSQGSTPRRATSKMLVFPDGSIQGTVGGGEMENRVIAAARQALLDGSPQLLSYNITDPTRGDQGVWGRRVGGF
jgi:xanthine dehydrogenase accessory factor